jgi:hypothetical protein
VDHPFKPRERRKIGHIRIGISGLEEFVHTAEVTDVDQSLGKIHGNRCTQRAVLRRERERAFEQVYGGDGISPLAGSPAGEPVALGTFVFSDEALVAG